MTSISSNGVLSGFRLGHSATETFLKLQQVYGDSVLSKAQVFRWFKAFSEERESIEDETRSGRLLSSRTDENVDRMLDLVRSDRCRLTVIMIGEELNLTHTTVHQILTNELEMRKNLRKNGSKKPFARPEERKEFEMNLVP